MPAVPAGVNQDFRLTVFQSSQANGVTDASRLLFWGSRLNDSRDPLGPLAIDVVNDAFLLGCIANRRYLSFAIEGGATTNLTDVGVLIMRAHADAVQSEESSPSPFLVGKLGVRQIADYHHDVFTGLGLSRRTYGGTPITGLRSEAPLYGPVFCQSCDDDL